MARASSTFRANRDSEYTTTTPLALQARPVVGTGAGAILVGMLAQNAIAEASAERPAPLKLHLDAFAYFGPWTMGEPSVGYSGNRHACAPMAKGSKKADA
jgi:hypothetical protein